MKDGVRYSVSTNRNGELKNHLNDHEPFDLVILRSCRPRALKGADAEWYEKRYPLEFPAVLERVSKVRPVPKSVWLSGFSSVEEVKGIFSLIRDSLEDVNLFKCPELPEFSFLEDLPALKTLRIYWNTKATKCFDASKTKRLIAFEMMDCNKVVEFSGLKNSSLERLYLYGCNGCSSFTSKLDAGDLDFLADMPNLKTLGLDIMKTRPSEVLLNAIAKAKSLEKLSVGSSFFTFEQFAWLSAQLPNVKEDLEPCTAYRDGVLVTRVVPEADKYSVIGRHKTACKAEKAKKYQEAYDCLRAEYGRGSPPPSDDYRIII